MLNGLRWLESLLDRVGLGDVMDEAVETVRYYVLGKQPDEPRRSAPATAPAAPHVYAREAVEPEPSISLVPVPTMGRVEVRPAEARRKPSAKSGTARAKKAAGPAKKAGATAKKAAGGARKKAAAKKSSGGARAASAEAGNVVGRLVSALRAHPKQEDLVSAGRQKDQLLRSLIPLYLARSLDVEVTSGTTSRFWGEFGVTYAAPNAAKALRLHAGFAQDTKKGKAITAKGVKYVESALAQLQSE